MIENIKEISKAEFVRRITSGESLFVGISKVMRDIEIDAVRQRRINRGKSRTRTCELKSNNHLIFEDSSHLDLKDVKPHTFVKCYATDDNILVVEYLNIDWDGDIEGTSYEYLYYTMEE